METKTYKSQIVGGDIILVVKNMEEIKEDEISEEKLNDQNDTPAGDEPKEDIVETATPEDVEEILGKTEPEETV